MYSPRKLLLALAALFVASCADVTSVSDELDPWDLGTLGPSLSVVPSLPPVCGEVTTTRLIADEVVPVGTVAVTQGPADLYVVYRTDAGWPILNTSVFVGTSPSEIPLSGGGNPRVGKFPYKAKHRTAPNEVVWEIPLASLGGPDVVVAAFAQVGETVEGAWGEGEMISAGGNWSMYFTHTVESCAAQTVDAGGGTVSTPGGDASIQIPAGALTAPVDITIDPSSVEELLEHTQSAQAVTARSTVAGAAASSLADGGSRRMTAASEVPGRADYAGSAGVGTAALMGELPTVNGVVPIEGTVWDYGPDGLEFELPATVTLSYEDAWIPEGVDEADLRIFVINGIYVEPPSTVDPVLNTVTAEIEHFSFVYIGFLVPAEVDLEMTDLYLSHGQPKVGATIDFSSNVKNLGPDASSGGTVTYQAFGDVVLGSTFGSCTEFQNPFPNVPTIVCDVAPLAVDATDGIEAFQLIPQSVGDVEIWATVNPADGDEDGNDANDRQELIQAIGPAVEVDLTVTNLRLALGQPIIGETLDFSTDVENLGPDASNGGTLTYQVFGAAVLGSLFGSCTEVQNPFPNVPTIQCDVAALAAGGTDGIEAFQVVPQAVGDITIWATVSPAAGDTDTGPDNNRQELTQPIAAGTEVDLEVTQLYLARGEPKVGETLDFSSNVKNLGPEASSGGTLVYQAFGDVVLGSLFGSCTEIENPFPAVPTIRCDVAPLDVDGIDGIEAFQLIPQSVGEITIWATVNPAPGDFDGNDANDRQELVLQITPTVQADLEVTSLRLFNGTPEVGAVLDFSSDVTNNGPDAATGGTLTYQAFGDVALGNLFGSCTEFQNPFPNVPTIQCDVAALAAGSTDGIEALQLIPQSGGDIEIWATVSTVAGETDTNSGNNRKTLTLNIPNPTADLRVDRLTDTPDPVSAGGQVTYEVDLISVGTTAPVNGAVLQLLFTNGDATFGSSALTCNPIAGGVGCFLDPLQPGLVQTVQVDMTLPTAGQTVDVEARIVVPAGITDTDQTNNSRFESTTVDAAAPSQLAFGDILEDATTTPGDTTWYSFGGVPGEIARVQVWVLQDAGYSIQLVIRNPAGDEIFPDGIPRGRATDNSSANYVFGMGSGNYSIGLVAFGTGPYRLGLGTGAGRLDESYSTEGTGVAYGPNSSAADPFFDWDWVGDEITVVGEEELVRFDGNGELVGAFGSGGVVDLAVLGAGRWGRAVGVQPDGKIVVAARQTISPYPWIIARFDASGALDPAFGTSGITEVQLGNRSDASPLGVGFQQNGADLDIVVGGHAGALAERVGIVRLKPDGSVDTGFGVGGTVFEARAMTPRKMAMQSDGSILVHGWDDLLRYTRNGVLDTSFGVGGIVDYAIPGNAFGIDVLPDDRLIVTGADIGNAFVMRLTADGARDGTFAGGGYQTYDFGFTNERFQAATPDGAGGLIAVGYQRTAGTDYEWLVSRMSFDGVLDQDFATAGYLTEIRVDNALAVRMDSAGRIVVGGQAENSLRGIELTRHIPD